MIYMWKIGGSFSYLRSIEEKDYSFSMNFYHLIERDVSMEPNSYPPLTLMGQQIYHDEASDFRLVCGDQIIMSYKEKALLTISMNLEFHQRSERNQFKAGMSVGIGFYSVSAEI